MSMPGTANLGRPNGLDSGFPAELAEKGASDCFGADFLNNFAIFPNIRSIGKAHHAPCQNESFLRRLAETCPVAANFGLVCASAALAKFLLRVRPHGSAA